MGRYQTQRGDPETKLFYIVDQLVGGVNTDFSDDTSPDNEFRSIVNFTMDKRGSLYKRMGFGKLDALSQIFNMFERLPEVRSKTPENPDVELTNDNIVYMKILVNDNLVFRNLSAFAVDKAYRQYQKVYGFQNNSWSLLMITSNKTTGKSTAWLFDCTLPELNYDEQGIELEEETIEVSSQVYDLPVFFNWNDTLTNIETLEFFDKIYFTTNNKGLVCFDRSKKEFSYSGKGIEGVENGAYKPNAMEIRKVGFNVLGDEPLNWIDYQGLNTNSIQGIYLTTKNDIPINVFPSGGVFKINVLYTGDKGDFDITFNKSDSGVSIFFFKFPEYEYNDAASKYVALALTPTMPRYFTLEYSESFLTKERQFVFGEFKIDENTRTRKHINYGTVDNDRLTFFAGLVLNKVG